MMEWAEKFERIQRRCESISHLASCYLTMSVNPNRIRTGHLFEMIREDARYILACLEPGEPQEEPSPVPGGGMMVERQQK